VVVVVEAMMVVGAEEEARGLVQLSDEAAC
jgi:hypothetical protein